MSRIPGLLCDRYQIQRQLGKNGGRQTLLAYDRTTNTPVVIKLLAFDSEFEWDDLKLFTREAETLKSLSHPNIPRYLDFFEIDTVAEKQIALVQSYVNGQSLQNVMTSGRILTEVEIKALVTSLLNILIYLHQQNPPVIHRDIKPSNVLIQVQAGSKHQIGDIFLVDFGSVQTLATQAGQTVTVVGTYGYMPPEQFGGRAVPASDLYSLGAMAIALATGKHPADLSYRDLRLQFQPVTNFSSDFADWLQRMTEPDLKIRFTSARAAMDALESPPDNLTVQRHRIKTGRILSAAIGHCTSTAWLTFILYFGAFILALYSNLYIAIFSLVAFFPFILMKSVFILIVGVIQGLILVWAMDDKLNPLQPEFSTIIGFVSTVYGIISSVVIGMFISSWLGNIDTIVLIQILIVNISSAIFSGHRFTRWYRREMLKRTKRETLN